MSSLEMLKLIVQPVVLERDDDGKIVGEILGQATPIYSSEHLPELWDALERELITQQLNAQGRNGNADRASTNDHRDVRQPELSGP